MSNIKEYLGFHSTALSLREKRNDILASNIANAATPNFKARDIDFSAEMNKANNLGQLDVTNSGHIKTFSSKRGDRTLYRDPVNPSLDGNTVELSVEQMEFSENVMRYQTTLTFLNNKISGLMSAIRGE